MTRPNSTRRDFLKRSAAAAGAVPYFWSSARAQAEAPSDKLRVGAIGCGGRGSAVGHQAGGRGTMIACCDVDSERAAKFANRYQNRCRIYGDYRKLLERDDIDVVTIGTPDHWHTKIAIEAMRAGKDVYCEKPLTLTIEESRQICQVTEQTGRIFQVGTQQRSEYNRMFLKAAVMARSGRLGKKLHALSSVGKAQSGGPFPTADPPANLNWDMWLGQAPKVPYCEKRMHYQFRWWFEYSGGQVTDWGVHHTDIAIWALGGEETGPVEIEGQGQLPLGSEDVLAMLRGERPSVEPNSYNVAREFDCNMALPNGNMVRLYSGSNELILEGELGKIRVNRRGLTGKPVEELSEADKRWLDEEVQKLYRGMPLEGHMANFFHCVKTRKKPISDVWTHTKSVNACHMANLAMLLGRKLRWDPEKYQFVGDDDANALMSRKQREPYGIEV